MAVREVKRAEARCGFGRLAVIRAQGCNLKCLYCSFGYLQSDKLEEDVLSWDQALSWVEKRADQFEAVLFSGGEPTLAAELQASMMRVRALGLGVALETNGTRPEVLRELFSEGLVDFVAMDVKAPVANYCMVAGCRCNIEDIRSSIWHIKHSGLPHEFRTTVVPGLHTARELRSIAEMLHGADRFVVQDFVSANSTRPEFRGRTAFPHKPLEDLRPHIEKRVKAYEIRSDAAAIPMPVRRRRRPLRADAFATE